MSLTNLQSKAIELAHSNAPDATDNYNRVLDQLERKLSADAFYAFASSIFGEEN